MMKPDEALPRSLDRKSEERARVAVSNVIGLRPHVVFKTVTKEPAQEPVKMDLMEGYLMSGGQHEGKPGFYHVVEDAPDHGYREDSLTSMARKILGDQVLSLRADPSNTPETLLHQAEALKSRMEDPEVQKLIRSIFEQRERLKRMLGVR